MAAPVGGWPPWYVRAPARPYAFGDVGYVIDGPSEEEVAMKKGNSGDDRVVVALGGNALGDTPEEQIRRVRACAPALIGLIEQGNEIIITHGNGPQVGMLCL